MLAATFHTLLSSASAAAITRYLTSDTGDRMPALTIKHLDNNQSIDQTVLNQTYPTVGEPTRIIVVSLGLNAQGAGLRLIDAVTINGVAATLIGGDMQTLVQYGHAIWAAEIPASDSVTVTTSNYSSGTLGWRVTQIKGVSWSEFITKLEYQTTSVRRPQMAITMDGPGVLISTVALGIFASDTMHPTVWDAKDGDRYSQFWLSDTKNTSCGTLARVIPSGTGIETLGLTQEQTDTTRAPSLGVLILRTVGENTEENNVWFNQMNTYTTWSFTGTQAADLGYWGTGSDREILVVVYHGSALTGVDGMTHVATQVFANASTGTTRYLSIYHAPAGAAGYPLRIGQAVSDRLVIYTLAIETGGGYPDIQVISSGAEDGVTSVTIPTHTSTEEECLLVISAQVGVAPATTAPYATPSGWKQHLDAGTVANRRVGIMSSPFRKAGNVEPAIVTAANNGTAETGIGYIYLAIRPNPAKKQPLQRVRTMNKYVVAKQIGPAVSTLSKYTVMKQTGPTISKVSKYVIVKAI